MPSSPLVLLPASGSVGEENLVMVSSASGLQNAATGDDDRIFNYLEKMYPQFISPSVDSSSTVNDYYYRYYSDTVSYIATAGGVLYYYAPQSSADIIPLGNVTDWVTIASQAGY